MSYDRALTVFSPDGHLFQVEYAMEAVRKGATAVGVLGQDCVILAAEKKSVPRLQDARTTHKIVALDSHAILAFAGLTADARILIDRARVEAQSYRLTIEDAPSPQYLTRWIAQLQQKYTHKGGARPFGLSTLVAGCGAGGEPFLGHTDPSGNWAAWRAHAIGHGSKTVSECLEKALPKGAERPQRAEAVKIAVRALLEVVESPKNIEVAVAEKDGHKDIPEEEIAQIVEEIRQEKENNEEAARQRRSQM